MESIWPYFEFCPASWCTSQSSQVTMKNIHWQVAPRNPLQLPYELTLKLLSRLLEWHNLMKFFFVCQNFVRFVSLSAKRLLKVLKAIWILILKTASSLCKWGQRFVKQSHLLLGYKTDSTFTQKEKTFYSIRSIFILP